MADTAGKKRSWAGNLGEGGFFLALSALLYYLTTRFDSAPAALSQNIPPEFFPQLVISIIALLACLLPFQQARAGKNPLHKKTALAAACLWFACAVFQYVGALPAMVTVCAMMAWLWGERRPQWVALYAVLYPAAVYGLFGVLLNVRFPEGLLWN